MDHMAAQVLGKYRILEEIGSGGFATVYRAADTRLEPEVALKVLDPLLTCDGAFVERFQREARAAAGLEQPNIVPMYEVDEEGGRLFIAMRLTRGPNLAERLAAEGLIPWEATLEILRPVCDALTYAHDRGVIHRDIKPHNILMDDHSGAMLRDFGFARLVGTSSLSQSLSGGVVGTPAYVAPEVLEGADATPATDVYALACVTYEMLAGNVLFGGPTPMAVMRAHDRGAQLPGEWPIEVPREIGDVMAQALARQPVQRYARVAEFQAALEGLQTAAVAERIAAEVDRLFHEMPAALDEARFEDAIAAGERLLQLQSNHEEAARLLGEAQSKLAKRRELAAVLDQERAALEEDQQRWADRSTALTQALSEFREEEKSLAAQRGDLEERWEALERAERLCQERSVQLQRRSEELDGDQQTYERRAQRLERARKLLQDAHMNELEALLARSDESPAEAESLPAEASATLAHAQEADVEPSRIRCPKCQGENRASKEYCVRCHSPLFSASPDSAADEGDRSYALWQSPKSTGRGRLGHWGSGLAPLQHPLFVPWSPMLKMLPFW